MNLHYWDVFLVTCKFCKQLAGATPTTWTSNGSSPKTKSSSVAFNKLIGQKRRKVFSTHKFDVPNPSPAMLVTITTMQAGRPVNSYFSHSVIRLVLEFLRLKQYMHTLLGDRFHSGPLNKDLTQVKVFRNWDGKRLTNYRCTWSVRGLNLGQNCMRTKDGGKLRFYYCNETSASNYKHTLFPYRLQVINVI